MSINDSALRQNNLEAIHAWERTYNTGNIEIFVNESYLPDADVFFTGASAHGHAQFKRVEQAVIDGAPGRHMRVDNILWVDDEVAVVEAVVLDSARPEFFSPFCAILKFRDGKIVTDRTYLDPSNWPAIEFAAPHASPGGLGAGNI